MSCPDCFTGSVHEGQPRGKIIKLFGLDTYVTEPADDRQPKGIIVIIPDAFGWDFVNNRLLADNYANKGDYTVYLPDFMNGHSASQSVIGDMRGLMGGSWIWKPLAKATPIVTTFFQELRKDQGADAHIGAAGFCWGGKHVMLLSHGLTVEAKALDGTTKAAPLLNAGFTGHPSNLVLPDDIDPKRVTVPVSHALGELDFNIKPPQIKLFQESVSQGPDDAARGEVVVYEKCGHGFCVRADSTLNDVTQAARDAEDQCINWFNKQFGF